MSTTPACAAGGGAKGKKKGGKVIAKDEDSDIYKVVKMLMEQQYDPVSLPHWPPECNICLPVLILQFYHIRDREPRPLLMLHEQRHCLNP